MKIRNRWHFLVYSDICADVKGDYSSFSFLPEKKIIQKAKIEKAFQYSSINNTRQTAEVSTEQIKKAVNSFRNQLYNV